MNGRGARASDQNNCLFGHVPHSDTLRVDALTRTVTKLLNRVTSGYSSQVWDRHPRRRVSMFYTLRT